MSWKEWFWIDFFLYAGPLRFLTPALRWPRKVTLTHPDQSKTCPTPNQFTDVRAFIKLCNKLDTGAYIVYFALQAPNSILEQGFFSVYASGGPLPPFSSSLGQTEWRVFTHTSTCKILCTSHNWSMTVTGYIRCFFYILFTQVLCDVTYFNAAFYCTSS